MSSVVKTRSGWLRGLFEEGVLAFHGIPYAQPPVASLRFCPPPPPLPWDGVREAYAYGPAPMQGGNALSAQQFPEGDETQ